MMSNNPGSELDPLDDIVESILQRQRKGERPSLTEYVERHPDLAERLREVYPALVMVEELGSVGGPPAPVAPTEAPQRLGDFRILREIGRGGMGVVYEAMQESLGRHVALKVLSAHFAHDAKFIERFRREARAAARLHHTNIVPVFSVGEEAGTCYYAMQYIQGQTLDAVLEDVRRLRGLGAGAASTPTQSAGRTGATGGLPASARPSTGGQAASGTPSRSVAEGLLTGHFGAGPLTVDDAANPPAAATPVPAVGDTSTLGNQPEAAYFRGVARLGFQAAEALAYAHGQNILHRDIKPSNLLLDVHGTLWVTDFGLAKAQDGTNLTQAGDILGTFRYMAPERFQGQSDPRSDVYALGVTLYEMLALRPPFAGQDRAELMDQISRGTPAPLRRLVPLLPRDLETIVQTAMAREPAARYAGAADLADDLQRFLENRPIKARRSSTVENLRRWCRRNPVVAGLSAVSLLLLIVTAVGGAVMSLLLIGALGQAQDAVREGKRKLFESYISDADATRMSRRPGQRFNSLRRVRDALAVGREIGLTAEDKLKLRNVAIAALCLPDLEPGPAWSPGSDDNVPDEIDPVHRRQARANAVLDQLLKQIPPPAGPIHGFSWDSLDGRFLVVPRKPYDKVTVKVRVWRIDGEQPVRVFDDSDGVHEEAVAFRPDGQQVALGHANGSVSVYDLETRERIRRLPPESGPTFCLAYHPTLPRLAVANGTEVSVWDVEAGKRLVRMRQPGMVSTVAWHPRGHRLAVGFSRVGWDKIQLWDAETGQPLTGAWEGHTTGGIRLTFDHSGDRVVSNDWDNFVRLWDAATGQMLLSRPGSAALSRFGSDDRSLGITGGLVRTFKVAEGRELRMMLRPTPQGPEPFLNYSLHPGGRLLAAVLPTGLGFFDLLTREEVGFVKGHFTPHLGFDSTGALWTAGGAGLARWPVRVSDDSTRLRIGPPEWVASGLLAGDYGFNWSGDGRIATVSLYSNGTRVIHRGPRRRTFRLGPQIDVRSAPVSPDGQWVVSITHHYGTSGVRFKVWEADTGQHLASLPLAEANSFHGFSPDSRWIYFGGGGGKGVRRLEIASLKAGGAAGASAGAPAAPAWRAEWKSEAILSEGLSSPDNRLRAYGTSEGIIRLVEAETDKEIARIPPPTEGRIGPSAFSRDGSLLLAYEADKHVLCLFDLYLIRKQLAELGLDWDEVQPLPKRATDYDPARAAWLRVELIEAESAGSLEKMAEAERRRAASRLAANPFDAEAHFRLGRSLSVTGPHREAYARLTAALAFDPDLEEALSLRGQVAWRLNRWDNAAADAGRYLAKVPFDNQMRLLRARSNRARKHYEDAVADYTTLCTNFPGSAVVFAERAECYEALGKQDLARADRKQARFLGGQGGLAFNNQAWHLVTGPVGHRDPAKALELIRKALDYEPENAYYLNTLGVVLYRNGQLQEALAALEISLAASQGQTDAFDLFFLAMCHARLGDPAKAKDCFDRAVRWWAGRKDLSAQWVAELTAFRAEAEAVLQGKAD
jgi:serine/threonine protein kinase/WD40 repeat protein/tetratricopeptide (TPR) repeat protein